GHTGPTAMLGEGSGNRSRFPARRAADSAIRGPRPRVAVVAAPKLRGRGDPYVACATTGASAPARTAAGAHSLSWIRRPPAAPSPPRIRALTRAWDAPGSALRPAASAPPTSPATPTRAGRGSVRLRDAGLGDAAESLVGRLELGVLAVAVVL